MCNCVIYSDRDLQTSNNYKTFKSSALVFLTRDKTFIKSLGIKERERHAYRCFFIRMEFEKKKKCKNNRIPN